jgi:hypothetical protein
MPLRVAGYFARNRSRPEGTRFPAPSCGQALRPAPIMEVGGSLMLVGYASAAINKCLWLSVRLFVCSFVRLFVCSRTQLL